MLFRSNKFAVIAAENAGVRAGEADLCEEGLGSPVLQRCEQGAVLKRFQLAGIQPRGRAFMA
uniref:Uncharacterized protein n=1 Tax=Arundo donax TaxID=35708 RepID=A0A0A9CNL7_ARUDO